LAEYVEIPFSQKSRQCAFRRHGDRLVAANPRVKLAVADGVRPQPEDQSAARPGLRKSVHAALRGMTSKTCCEIAGVSLAYLVYFLRCRF